MDTNTQGVALEQRLRELAHLRYAPMQRASEEWQAADLIGDLREQVERLERENETYRTAFDGIEPAAQEGREAVAWQWLAYDGWRMCEHEAEADRLRSKGLAVRPLYPTPAQPAAQVVDIDALAQEIRRVDGSNTLGAGALAEALAPFLSALADADTAVPVLREARDWISDNIREGDIAGCSLLGKLSALTAAKAGEDGR